jgi:hypothetical protein
MPQLKVCRRVLVALLVALVTGGVALALPGFDQRPVEAQVAPQFVRATASGTATSSGSATQLVVHVTNAADVGNTIIVAIAVDVPGAISTFDWPSVSCSDSKNSTYRNAGDAGTLKIGWWPWCPYGGGLL